MPRIKPLRTAAWKRLNKQIVACDRCPRLLAHCRQIARKSGARLQSGPIGAGRWRTLATPSPAAHRWPGAGCPSRQPHGPHVHRRPQRRVALSGASQSRICDAAPVANRDDDLRLIDCAITATCHCAPPDNKPTIEEICRLPLLAHPRPSTSCRPDVSSPWGSIAWQTIVAEARRRGWIARAARNSAMARSHRSAKDRWLLGSYHPSQQNTFTGRLTEAMFDACSSKPAASLGQSIARRGNNADTPIRTESLAGTRKSESGHLVPVTTAVICA